MSKLITLSNLGYFLNKLNLSNSITRLIQNIPTSPKGNIYLDTANQLLKYKKGNEWHEITLYEEKPTENTLALRIGKTTYYAGLVDVTAEQASDLRIRMNNVVYAVAYEKQSPSGVKELAASTYVQNTSGIALWGETTVEIYARIQAPHHNEAQSTNDNYYDQPILRMFQHGTAANAQKNTTSLPDKHKASNVYFEICFAPASLRFFATQRENSTGFKEWVLDTYNDTDSKIRRWTSPEATAEYECQLICTPDGNIEFFCNGTSICVYCERWEQ